MRHLPRLLARFTFASVLAVSVPAWAQSYDLAVRTSGTLLRPGDQLRVELVALQQFSGPFTAQIAYRWDVPVIVRDENGGETTTTKEETRESPRTALIQSLEPFQGLLLDDTVFAGTQPPGPRQIDVTVYLGATTRVLTRMRTVVYFGAFPKEADEKTLVLRGVKRANSTEWVTLDGTFPSDGRYSLLIMDGRKVVGWVDGGLTVTGPHAFDVISPLLATLKGRPVDLVLHDHQHGISTTLARFTMPPPL